MPDEEPVAMRSPERRQDIAMPISPTAQGAWLDRRCAEDEIPEKIRRIGGWKRAMRDFMAKDARLNDLVSLFAQKFTKQGTNRNFTLSTLLDMSWTVLILTWEAIIEERLPTMDEVDIGFKKRYEELQAQMYKLRMNWLSELADARASRRDNLSPVLQAAASSVQELDDGDVFRFVPEDAMDEQTKAFFKMALEENMKVAMTRGGAAMGEQAQAIATNLVQKEEECEELKKKVEVLEAMAEQFEVRLQEALEDNSARKGVAAPVRRLPQTKHTDEEYEKVQASLSAATKEKDAMETKNRAYADICAHFGFNVQDLLDEELQNGGWRKLLPKTDDRPATANGPSKEELEQERERCMELEQAMSVLEEKSQGFARELEESRVEQKKQKAELESKANGLSQQVEKLTKELATATAAAKKGPAKAPVKVGTGPAGGADPAELSAAKQEAQQLGEENSQLKNQVSSQNKQLKDQQEKLENALHQLEAIRKKGPASADKEAAEKATKEAEKQAARATALEGEVKSLTGQVETLQEASEASAQEAEALRTEVQSLREELQARNVPSSSSSAKSEKVVERVVQVAAEPVTVQDPEAKKALKQAQAMAQEAEEVAIRAEKKMEKLEKKLAQSQEVEEKLRAKNDNLKDALKETKAMKEAVENAMQELQGKFEEMKQKLAAAGVDTSTIDQVMNDIGMEKVMTKATTVFDRLYYDAIKRIKLNKEKKQRKADALVKREWEKKLGMAPSPDYDENSQAPAGGAGRAAASGFRGGSKESQGGSNGDFDFLDDDSDLGPNDSDDSDDEKALGHFGRHRQSKSGSILGGPSICPNCGLHLQAGGGGMGMAPGASQRAGKKGSPERYSLSEAGGAGAQRPYTVPSLDPVGGGPRYRHTLHGSVLLPKSFDPFMPEHVHGEEEDKRRSSVSPMDPSAGPRRSSALELPGGTPGLHHASIIVTSNAGPRSIMFEELDDRGSIREASRGRDSAPRPSIRVSSEEIAATGSLDSRRTIVAPGSPKQSSGESLVVTKLGPGSDGRRTIAPGSPSALLGHSAVLAPGSGEALVVTKLGSGSASVRIPSTSRDIDLPEAPAELRPVSPVVGVNVGGTKVSGVSGSGRPVSGKSPQQADASPSRAVPGKPSLVLGTSLMPGRSTAEASASPGPAPKAEVAPAAAVPAGDKQSEGAMPFRNSGAFLSPTVPARSASPPVSPTRSPTSRGIEIRQEPADPGLKDFIKGSVNNLIGTSGPPGAPAVNPTLAGIRQDLGLAPPTRATSRQGRVAEARAKESEAALSEVICQGEQLREGSRVTSPSRGPVVAKHPVNSPSSATLRARAAEHDARPSLPGGSEVAMPAAGAASAAQKVVSEAASPGRATLQAVLAEAGVLPASRPSEDFLAHGPRAMMLGPGEGGASSSQIAQLQHRSSASSVLRGESPPPRQSQLPLQRRHMGGGMMCVLSPPASREKVDRLERTGSAPEFRQADQESHRSPGRDQSQGLPSNAGQRATSPGTLRSGSAASAMRGESLGAPLGPLSGGGAKPLRINSSAGPLRSGDAQGLITRALQQDDSLQGRGLRRLSATLPTKSGRHAPHLAPLVVQGPGNSGEQGRGQGQGRHHDIVVTSTGPGRAQPPAPSPSAVPNPPRLEPPRGTFRGIPAPGSELKDVIVMGSVTGSAPPPRGGGGGA